MKLGIAILATNAYFVLGLRFINKWMHYYKGNAQTYFHFFSDKNPHKYIAEKNNCKIILHSQSHSNWVAGTNSKFQNIISLENENLDYIYYFDADTNITRHFTEDWFLGELVGGEHFGNNSWMKDNKGFDRNPNSKAFVPLNTTLPQMYYYGAFFGGTKQSMLKFCKTLKYHQEEDRKINYEPGCNDESYINAYFHYNPPQKTVLSENFEFDISDKGGIGETRAVNLNIDHLLYEIQNMKNKVWDIQHNKVVQVN